MANLLKPKWEYGLAIALFIAFLTLSIFYFIDIIDGEPEKMAIISFIVYFASAVVWFFKVIQDRKKMKQ